MLVGIENFFFFQIKFLNRNTTLWKSMAVAENSIECGEMKKEEDILETTDLGRQQHTK
jgi:hypothetical protein